MEVEGTMKKIIKKLLKKEEAPAIPSRITTETIAEHREQILAGGRRFKYPLQYSRHKLVFNAIIISVVALLLIVLFGWWRLYIVQDTGDFIYRVTRVVPVPVAKVDGQPVSYSDYLMAFRSSVYYAEQKEQLNIKTDDGKKKVAYYKQQSMQGVLADAYAKKIARELSITLTDAELEAFLKEQRQSSNGEISQQTYDASTLEFFGLSPEEYKHRFSNVLLRYKVEYAVDKQALIVANSIIESARSGASIDFGALASSSATKYGVGAVYGTSGWVYKTNQDGGLAANAAKLSKGQVAPGLVKSSRGTGYYILRLVDINDTQVSYEYINVPLSEFATRLSKVLDSNKTKKYIKL